MDINYKFIGTPSTFTPNNDNDKWNNKVNNKVQHGIYSYSILVNDFKNKPFIYTGIITILK